MAHEVTEETREKIRNSRTYGESIKLLLECARCHKKFTRKRWVQNMLMKKSTTGNVFCSNKCASTGRILSEETKEKIKMSQIGIPKPQSGVMGHEVSEATRIKMSLNKTGIPIKADWDIVLKELQYKHITKYTLTRAPIPDAIWMEDGKIVSLELEKKRKFSSIKEKMNAYKKLDLTHHNAYEKVYLVWYTPDGIRREEWLFENGVWTKIWTFTLG